MADDHTWKYSGLIKPMWRKMNTICTIQIFNQHYTSQANSDIPTLTCYLYDRIILTPQIYWRFNLLNLSF